MTDNHPKTIDGLIEYLHDSKNISIQSPEQKRRLMNMGYYHGYKGYRYINRATNRIIYNTFDELTAIYDFDSRLKALFYPFVMQIETALKNYVLDTIVNIGGSDSFLEIYNTQLDNYKSFSPSGKTYKETENPSKAEAKYKDEIKKRLELRNRIYRVQTDAFNSGNKIAVHFLHKDINLPIWAIFELLSFGEFGYFVSCLNITCRQAISEKLGIKQSDDTAALLLQRLIYATKDLRNAIAHNDVIFDTRFRTSYIDGQVSNAISNETGVSELNFKTITDYLVLIVYQLSLLQIPKYDIKGLIEAFCECTEKLREAIPISIYNQIIYTNNGIKIVALKKYLK